MITTIRIPIALLAGVSALALAQPAAAQTPLQDSAPQPAGTAQPVAAGEAGDIVVTGSRVISNGNNMPTPVTVVQAEDLRSAHPTNLSEAMNDLPVFAGSRSQFSNSGTSGAAGAPATSTNALNVINLRNMGLQRTLILFDGHRVPPSTPEGFVDVDTVPQLLLKRADVVTGGVSAVYGSDAVVGVVNFITDTSFNGVKVNGQYGISRYNDDQTYEAGLAVGTRLFDGRGHLMGSLSYRKDDGIPSKFDRPWGADLRTLQGLGTAAFPYFQVIGARASNATFGGRVNSGILGDTQFTTGGVLIPFVHGAKTGQGGTIPASQAFEIGGDGGYYNSQLRSSLETKQAYGRFDFDITDNLHFYAWAAGTDKKSLGIVNYFAQLNVAIARDNAFLLPAYRTALANANQATFNFGKIFDGLPRSQLFAHSKQFLGNVGLQGDLGGSWKWEASYMAGASKFHVTQRKAINMGRFYAALDSVLVNGVPTCRAALTNSVYAGCVPLNVFGPKSESQAAIDYIVAPVDWTTKLRSHDVAGSVTGSPFSTWAGPVNIAISGEWRRNTERVDSNSLPSVLVNCTGIGIVAGNAQCNRNSPLYNATVANMPLSKNTVSEIAGELEIPLARDMAFFKSLTVNLAARHARYKVAGNANTWKIGATWEPSDLLTLRATRSRDFRAPTLDELFRPQALSLTNFTDTINPNNVVTLINTPTYNGGNPGLKPEIAQNLTAGIVFKPTRNLSFSVDYFDIKVKNFIFLVQGNSPPEQEICYASGGSSTYCSLIARGLSIYDRSNAQAFSAANAVSAWYQLPINIAQQNTYGVDFEANYRANLFSRPFSLRVLAVWQPHIRFKRAGAVANDYGGVAFGTNGIQASPKWRMTAFLNFKPVDGVSIDIMERWRSSLDFHSDPTFIVASPKIKSVGFTNVNVTWDLPTPGTKTQLFLNVANLFDTAPPQAGFWGNPNPGQFGEFVQGFDDVIGRYFTVGARVRF